MHKGPMFEEILTPAIRSVVYSHTDFVWVFLGMPSGLGDILNDPELLAAFQDPEVSKAFMEISQNPAAAEKYKNDPKVCYIDRLQLP